MGLNKNMDNIKTIPGLTVLPDENMGNDDEGLLTTWKLTASPSKSTDILTDFGGHHAPKLRFLFSVSFNWHPSLVNNAFGNASAAASLSAPAYASDNEMARMGYMSYDCKTASRPTVNVTYADVNRYNFREKIATKKEYSPLTLTFYDDNQNTAHALFQAYLRIIAPDMRGAESSYSEFNTLHGTSPATNVTGSKSSIGNLPNGMEMGVLRNIRVTHHYSTSYTDDINQGDVYYDYINPKLQSVVFDDLDMSVSDVSMITATFIFDAVIITDSYAGTFPEEGGGSSSGAGTGAGGGDSTSVRPPMFPPPITGEIDGYTFGAGLDFI